MRTSDALKQLELFNKVTKESLNLIEHEANTTLELVKLLRQQAEENKNSHERMEAIFLHTGRFYIPTMLRKETFKILIDEPKIHPLKAIVRATQNLQEGIEETKGNVEEIMEEILKD